MISQIDQTFYRLSNLDSLQQKLSYQKSTGKKLEIAGELMKWWKLNIPAVMPSVCDCCVPRPEDPFEYDNPICEKCGLPIKQTDC